MTPYELQDLISTWIDSAMSRMRFWVSITFAVVAVGFVVGAELSTPLVGFIILVYTAVTGLAVLATRVAMIRVSLLLAAERSLAEDDDAVRAWVPGYVMRMRRLPADAMTPLFVFAYLGAVLYVLSASGLI
ncbi:MAG: hypothetical protein ACE363_12420 [Alphaproteobacteria bacterium]